ncbi:hypothetical protein J2W42_006022 [Rhizobium tibeticum]|uniref:hypothetical protein n=1 Tax=Rhizobium tibeticum TaxID=501024 RepID=UPI00278B63E8|nr:hypothetical protein [Rhizobium tibeticum]MDP9813151.1 hypothetical protein [Rhizobium tibeticum]
MALGVAAPASGRKAIDRVSEDVDLTYDIRALIPDLDRTQGLSDAYGASTREALHIKSGYLRTAPRYG